MDLWSVESEGGVVVATYHNPPMNYFCAEATQELGILISTWRSPEVRAVIVTGGMEGRFITHYSVEELLGLAEDRPTLNTIGTGLNHGYHELLRALRDLPKPVIAAMNGDTMGGGFELSLSCDIRIAAAGDHRFGLPEVSLGILPGGCGTQRLPRMIGRARALEMIVGAIDLDAETAERWGYLNRIFAPEDVGPRVSALARRIASFPAEAVRLAKESVGSAEKPLAEGLPDEALLFQRLLRSEAARNHMRRFLELGGQTRKGELRVDELVAEVVAAEAEG